MPGFSTGYNALFRTALAREKCGLDPRLERNSGIKCNDIQPKHSTPYRRNNPHFICFGATMGLVLLHGKYFCRVFNSFVAVPKQPVMDYG
jgi:hypothetical protein